MAYKAEVIRQAAKLLDTLDFKDDSCIEVFFHDEKSRIEIWSMLADEEKMIAFTPYSSEQKESSKYLEAKQKDYGFGGSLIPVLFRAFSDMIENGLNILDHSFIFDAEHEQLHAEDEGNNVRSWDY